MFSRLRSHMPGSSRLQVLKLLQIRMHSQAISAEGPKHYRECQDVPQGEWLVSPKRTHLSETVSFCSLGQQKRRIFSGCLLELEIECILDLWAVVLHHCQLCFVYSLNQRRLKPKTSPTMSFLHSYQLFYHHLRSNTTYRSKNLTLWSPRTPLAAPSHSETFQQLQLIRMPTPASPSFVTFS